MSDIGRITQLTTENKDRTDFHGVQCAIVPESTIEEWRAERDRLRAQLAVAGIEAQILRAENARLRAALESFPWPTDDDLGDVRVRIDIWDWYHTTRAEALK